MLNCKIRIGDYILYNAFAFVAFWYFFFSSSVVLRPFPYLVWAVLAGVGLFLAAVKHIKVNLIDVCFVGGILFFCVISLYTKDSAVSIYTVINYLVYYSVARAIGTFCSSKAVIRLILLFCMLHLLFLFLQVLAPEVYFAKLLPLLPEYVHYDIKLQMLYNHSYYGFTLQTSMVAMYLSFGALLSGAMLFDPKHHLTKPVYLCLTGLFVLGILLTVRRGSSVVVLFLLAMMFLSSKEKAGNKLLLALLALAVLAVIGVENIPGFSQILEKFSSLLSDHGSILNGRDITFAKAVDAFLQRPLLGHGIGQVENAIGYAWLENSYLVVLVECGLLGAILYFLPFLLIFKRTLAECRRTEKQEAFVRFSLYVQLMYLIMSCIENYMAAPATLFPFFVAAFSSFRCAQETSAGDRGTIGDLQSLRGEFIPLR